MATSSQGFFSSGLQTKGGSVLSANSRILIVRVFLEFCLARCESEQCFISPPVLSHIQKELYFLNHNQGWPWPGVFGSIANIFPLLMGSGKLA